MTKLGRVLENIEKGLDKKFSSNLSELEDDQISISENPKKEVGLILKSLGINAKDKATIYIGDGGIDINKIDFKRDKKMYKISGLISDEVAYSGTVGGKRAVFLDSDSPAIIIAN